MGKIATAAPELNDFVNLFNRVALKIEEVCKDGKIESMEALTAAISLSDAVIPAFDGANKIQAELAKLKNDPEALADGLAQIIASGYKILDGFKKLA